MTNQKFKKFAEVYSQKFREYDDYLKRFFTTCIDGQLINKEDKYLTDKESDKLDGMRKELERLEKEIAYL